MSTVNIPECRFSMLIEKAKRLDEILATHPELESGQKLTPAAKKYKTAFVAFVKRVDEVLSSEEIKSIFQIAYVHGFTYKGQSLAKDILDAKKLLGQ